MVAALSSAVFLVWTIRIVTIAALVSYNTLATAIGFTSGGENTIRIGSEIDCSSNETKISTKLHLPLSSFHSNSAATTIAARMREELRGDFPEIDRLCSDAYLESVAGVPGRSLEHAIHQKVKRSLEWRRFHGVDALRAAFVCVRGPTIPERSDDTLGAGGGGIFVPASIISNDSRHPNEEIDTTPTGSDDSTATHQTEAMIGESPPLFVPTQALLDVCISGAFVVRDEEWIEEPTTGSSRGCRRLVVRADTSRLNWWRTGVKAGLLYHVLVLEEAFERIRYENSQRESHGAVTAFGRDHDDNDDNEVPLSESIVVLVDTTGAPLLPPPLSAPRGMVQLLRKAYPDRIHRIYVGPVHPWLRTLYNYLASTLKPRTRDKIVLLSEAPRLANLSRSAHVPEPRTGIEE